MPAGFLLLAGLIAEGWRGRPRALATWAAIMLIGVLQPASIAGFGRGYPDPPEFAGVMLRATWVSERSRLAGTEA